MKVFFLLGAVAALDCSNEGFFSHSPNSGGTRVIYDNDLWEAQWSVNQVPGVDLGWKDLGGCAPMPPLPRCWPAWDPSAAYREPGAQVSVEQINYVNQWWADAGRGPLLDTENWLPAHPCIPGIGPVTTTSTPTMTTPTTSTTLAPPPPVTQPPTQPPPPPVTQAPTQPPPPPVTQAPTQPPPTQAPPPPTQAPPTAAPTTPTTTETTTAPTTTTRIPEGGNQRPTGPTGPNGECVWPAYVSAKTYRASFAHYVTHQGGVYNLAYHCDPGMAPGVSPCWKPKVATCTGEPPAVQLTPAELAAMVDPNGPKYQMFSDRWDPTSPTDAELAATYSGIVSGLGEAEKRMIAALRVLDTDSIEAIAPGRASNPENVQRVERLVPRSTFDQLFPVRNPVYTYENLLKGIGAFPAYCQTYADGRDSDKICVNLLITSFAHNTQEVGANIPSLRYKDGNHMMDGGIHYHPESDAYFTEGEAVPLWKQAFWFVREVGYTEHGTTSSPYRKCTLEGDHFPWGLLYQCPAGADYFGRGSKQLSWNFNYGMFSELFFGDASYLLSNPALVADTWLNIASGIWFAVTPQSPKPSMLAVIDGSWVPNSIDIAGGITAGFGATINIINGGLECGKGTVTQQVQNRINAYTNFASFFGYTIPPSEQLDCSKQRPFAEGGAGHMAMYWGNSYSAPFVCQLNKWQSSAYLVATPEGYQKCVEYFFRGRWVDRDTKQIVAQYGSPGLANPPA